MLEVIVTAFQKQLAVLTCRHICKLFNNDKARWGICKFFILTFSVKNASETSFSDGSFPCVIYRL